MYTALVTTSWLLFSDNTGLQFEKIRVDKLYKYTATVPELQYQIVGELCCFVIVTVTGHMIGNPNLRSEFFHVIVCGIIPLKLFPRVCFQISRWMFSMNFDQFKLQQVETIEWYCKDFYKEHSPFYRILVVSI